MPSRSQKMLITPQRAKDWLAEYNDGNYRKYSDQKIIQYSRNMREGRWIYTGAPICFDWNNRLVDGQNRLAALVEADVDLEFRVETGLDPESKYFMDLGKPRNTLDVLQAKGYSHAVVIGSTIRLAGDVEKYRMGKTPKGSSYTIPEIVDLAENDRLIQWVVQTVDSMVPKTFMNRTVAAYTFRILYDLDVDDCMKFFHSLVNADDLDNNPAIKALHRRLTLDNWNGVVGKQLRLQLVALVFRSWNAWRKGDTTVKLLKVSSSLEKRFEIPIPE